MEQNLLIGAITTLAGVIVFLFTLLIKAYAKYDALQEKRLQEAIAYRDTLAEPLRQQIELGQKTYDFILRLNERGK